MPKKNIEIGRTPNDGTGDNLKIVIAKVNENIDDDVTDEIIVYNRNNIRRNLN